MKLLFIIPARGGSKGIPGKNIKLLNGKPLIHYSIEYARLFVPDADICVTTDDLNIADCARQIGYEVPFMRPAALATDHAGSYEVLQHALAFYKEQGRVYDAIVLLQATSPFREKKHLEEALPLFKKDMDMVVSVTESAFNPYYNLFEENGQGLLAISKGTGKYIRRQDVPPVYAYNGSIYIINTDSLAHYDGFGKFSSVKKYTMEERYALDLDTPADWEYAEYICKNKVHE